MIAVSYAIKVADVESQSHDITLCVKLTIPFTSYEYLPMAVLSFDLENIQERFSFMGVFEVSR